MAGFVGARRVRNLPRRFREELARADIRSAAQASRAAGVPQQWLSRRMTEETDWGAGELLEVCERLGSTNFSTSSCGLSCRSMG